MIDLKKQARLVGVRQVELAERFGVSEPTMSRWLHRTILIPNQYLWAMSRALDVPLEELVDRPARTPSGRRAA